jgi:hypothetical protein
VLILAPFLVLISTAAFIAFLGVVRPRFVYHWVLAAIGSMAAWVLMWITAAQVPVVIGVLEGNFQGLALPTLAFRVDEITWPLGLAVVTLTLAVIFTDASRAAETSWLVWAGDLGLSAVGLAAVMAGNPSTMLLAWTIVDLIELGILLRQLDREEMRRRAFIFFAMNLLGTLVVFGAMIAAGSEGVRMNLDRIPAQSVVYLILAVGLRMGVFPLQVAFLRDVHHQRGQGTLLRLIPPVVSLSLLAHSSVVEVSAAWRLLLLFSAVLASAYGGIAWARSENELRGRLFWIIGVAGLCFASAVQGQQGAVLAWGLALLYPGAALFLSSVRRKLMLPIGILSLFTFSALPFSPTYAGLRMYQPLQPFLLLMPLAQLLLIGGYTRFMLKETEPLTGVEPWVRIIYLIGLAILPVTHIASVYIGPPIMAQGSIPIWPLLVVLGLAMIGVVAYWRKWHVPDNLFNRLDRFFSLRWIDNLIVWGSSLLEQTAQLITRTVEGEGGVLWTLLFLVMLVSILSQLGTGGGGL